MLIESNIGLRVGEQLQLRCNDVKIECHKVNDDEQTLLRIHVRAETNKVSTTSIFLCCNGQYFERMS